MGVRGYVGPFTKRSLRQSSSDKKTSYVRTGTEEDEVVHVLPRHPVGDELPRQVFQLMLMQVEFLKGPQAITHQTVPFVSKELEVIKGLLDTALPMALFDLYY
jgi:hypothetical protein